HRTGVNADPDLTLPDTILINATSAGLFQIDPNTGSSSLIGAITRAANNNTTIIEDAAEIKALAFSPDGTVIYAVYRANGTTEDRLMVIQASTGDGADLGAIQIDGDDV